MVIPDVVLPWLLDRKKDALEQLWYHLFRNDVTPTPTDDASLFVDADFPGYAPLHPIEFSSPFLNGDGLGQMNSEVLVWECVSAANPNTIFGYYVVDDSGYLKYSERFTTPVVMDTFGDLCSFPVKWLEAPFVL